MERDARSAGKSVDAVEQERGDGTGRFDFGVMVRTGAALGLKPDEVRAMNLRDFILYSEGVALSKGVQPKPEPPSDEWFDQQLIEHELAETMH